jgi:hypothetical protein
MQRRSFPRPLYRCLQGISTLNRFVLNFLEPESTEPEESIPGKSLVVALDSTSLRSMIGSCQMKVLGH